MGGVVSKAANGIGAVLGNAFVAPVKSVFGGNCENVCPGTWDITCFIEHLCVSNIVKLVMVFCLAYITLLFLYLLFKLGLVQCIVKSLCKMGWAACETYWFAWGDMTCFLWHKLINTKRVHRRRRRRRFKDVEEGNSSSEDTRRRRPVRESYGSKDGHRSGRHRHRHDVQLKTLKGASGRMRSSRQQLQVRRVGSFKLSKRRRIKR